MHLIPPMDDEPPPEYVAFVTLRQRELRAECARLVGGDPVADQIYLDVLTDVAGHWRRLRWWGRLTRGDAVAAYLRRRLTARTKLWRDDQIYEVEMHVLRPPAPVVPLITPSGSLALRKAAVIDGTARASLDALADAEIAWVHAYLRSQWRQIALHFGTVALVVIALLQYIGWLSTAGA